MREFTVLFLILGFTLFTGCIDKAHVAKADRNISTETREQKAASLRNQVDGLNSLTLEVAWYYPLPEEQITNFTHSGDLLFVETKRNLLYALEPDNGVVRWVFQLSDPLDFRPAISKDHVSFTAASVLYLLDTTGGNLIWKRNLPFTVSSATTLDKQNVYVGSFDDFFYAYGIGDGTKSWRYRTSGSIMKAPLTEDPSVYFISEDNGVYALNGSDGLKSWTFQMHDRATDNPYVRNNLLYVSSEDYNLYAINRITGNIAWKYEAGEEVMTVPVVSGDTCYAACRNKLVGVHNKSGRETFALDGHYKVLATGKKDVYVQRIKKVANRIISEMAVIDGEKGTIKAKAPVSKFKYFLTNHRDGMVYMASSDGVLFALKEE